MATTKIRSDEHGAYVVTNGSYYRPLLPDGYNHVDGCALGESAFATGSDVKVSAVSGSPLCRVRQDGAKELWYAHGQTGRFEGGVRKALPSSAAWMPSGKTWAHSRGFDAAAAEAGRAERDEFLEKLGIRRMAVLKAPSQ